MTTISKLETLPSVKIRWLGIALNPLTASQTADAIEESVVSRTTTWISNYNLHGLYLRHANPQYARSNSAASLFIIDGWPLLAACKFTLQMRCNSTHRVGSTDWLEELLSRGNRLTIAAVGGSEHSSAGAAQYVANKYPHIQWLAYDGFSFRKRHNHQDDNNVWEAMDRSDVVLVGLGMPNQEWWIRSNLESGRLEGKAVANVGGCFDYFSGTQKLAPRWLGAVGLEWLYRLASSPSRLAGRYLVEPFKLTGLLLVYNVKRGKNTRWRRR